MKLVALKAKGFVFKSFGTARFMKLTFHFKDGLAFSKLILTLQQGTIPMSEFSRDNRDSRNVQHNEEEVKILPLFL